MVVAGTHEEVQNSFLCYHCSQFIHLIRGRIRTQRAQTPDLTFRVNTLQTTWRGVQDCWRKPSLINLFVRGIGDMC
jgi:hypothetical protein